MQPGSVGHSAMMYPSSPGVKTIGSFIALLTSHKGPPQTEACDETLAVPALPAGLLQHFAVLVLAYFLAPLFYY
jgi:hypothetical protein